MRGSGAFRTSIVPGGALAGPWVANSLWKNARAVPSLDLRFAENKSLTDAKTGASLVTLTRASTGTYVGSDGLLRSAVTNLLTYSEQFDNAAWTKTNSTVTTNATTAPNGTLTAEKLITNNTASSGRASVSVTAAVTGSPATLSCFAKQGETSVFGLFISDGVTGRAADFDLITGTVSGTPTAGMTASIEAVGDGWYRCVAMVTSITGTTRSLRVIQTVSVNDGIKGLYIWGAQFEETSTAGEYIPTTSVINSAPRFDHNPTTGESLGLLVEEARTNSIRNNTGVGAVAGTPGTLPTNWFTFTSLTGLTRQIVGTGTENGISYLDVKLSGTPSAAGSYFLQFETSTGVAASNGQTWTSSGYFKLAGGSLTGITTINIAASLRDSGGGELGRVVTAFTPTSSDIITQRVQATVTNNNASTAAQLNYIELVLSGTAIDITIRIGLPQLEQGAFATSAIPTTTATVTRAADVASITGSNFGTTRTNLLAGSEAFDGSPWTKNNSCTITNDATASPTGTLTADQFNGAAISFTGVFTFPTTTSGAVYTFSIYIKNNLNATSLRLGVEANPTNAFVTFNAATGTITSVAANVTSSSVQFVGNGWYRVVLTYTATGTSAGLVIYSTSGAVATWFAWGAQLETGSTATAYIPTTTAAVSVFESSWYNQTEGTVYHQGKTPTAVNNFFSIDDATAGNRITSFMPSATEPYLFVSTAGSTAAYITSSAITAGSLFAQANAYKINDFAISTNGGVVSTDTNGNIPTVNKMVIGANVAADAYINGTIKRLVYWGQRLPNTTLQSITL